MVSAVQFVDTLDVLVSIPLARWTSLALTWTSLVHGSFLSQNRFFLTEWCTQVGLFSYVGDVGHIPSTVFLEKKNHQFLLQHLSQWKKGNLICLEISMRLRSSAWMNWNVSRSSLPAWHWIQSLMLDSWHTDILISRRRTRHTGSQ